jgi:prepilin-type processing-associated H-X9-DG protein
MVFTVGFFYGPCPSDGITINSRTRTSDILDGLSTTVLVGESLPNQLLKGIDYSGNQQKVDHWYIGPGELRSYENMVTGISPENSECLGSTACPSNSLMIADSPMNDKELSFGSAHPQGANIGYADGHVQFMNDSMEQQARSAIGSRHGRESDSTIR